MRAMAFGPVVGGLCMALVLAGTGGLAVTVRLAPPAAAASCDVDTRVRGDFDGDGGTDVAVGMPLASDQAGGVDLRGTGSPAQVLTDQALGAGTGEGDMFGQAIAIGDLDDDGCADLVIGSPAEGQSAVSDGAGDNEGQVHLVFGGPGGVSTTDSIVLPHDSANLDFFGSALALVGHDLYVGAPNATVGGHPRAGEVFHYTIAAGGSRRVTATLVSVITQDSAGVPGASEDYDGFGTVVASNDSGGVWVGAPLEDVGTKVDAGAVWYLRVSGSGATTGSQQWSQDSKGVPGAAEKDDHFGAAISSRDGTTAVGVPEEDDGRLTDGGMVQIFDQALSGRYTVGRALTQDSAGVPGKVEDGDRFGAAVAAGAALICPEVTDVAIGAPGEDIGTRTDAGAVTVLNLGRFGCQPKVLRQGSGLAGAAEAGDQVGSVLGLTRGDLDAEEDYSDRMLLGVPKEDIGARTDAGMVQPARGGISAGGVSAATLQYSGGYLASRGYGLVLSAPAGG